jgi:hypothetical protein
MAYVTRRSALTIIAGGGFALAAGGGGESRRQDRSRDLSRRAIGEIADGVR